MNYDLNLTIFGGTGDLTFRKLLPALYNMELAGRLKEHTRIVIIGRRDYDDGKYREMAREWVEKFARLPYQTEDFDRFAERIAYFRMDFSDLGSYEALNQYFAGDEIAEHIFYFAVAPRFFSVITEGLSQVSGAEKGKVIIEKPFGESLEAAKELNGKLESFFGNEQIYRIDHYLGKEMVRNIQAIRFTNPIFSDTWNSRFIEEIQISALEDVGVETRGGYYDASGALKDMVQNHLFQILSIVAMERPAELSGEGMHEEQMKVLRCLRTATRETIKDILVLGQYEGYREEPLVSSQSDTETYAGLRLTVDNERWQGTPFYIRTGKKAGRREMEVSVIFRRPDPSLEPDVLIIKIQPTEGVYLQFNIKQPGDSEAIVPTKMDFCQSCLIENQRNTPEAYERLLYACMKGERSWFSQWDQIELSWNFMEQLKSLYKEEELTVYPYAPGTPGPKEADDFIRASGHEWLPKAQV